MKQPVSPKPRQTVSAILFSLFYITELLVSLFWSSLSYVYDFYYPHHFFDSIIKAAILLLLISLAIQKRLWAVWVAGILLILQGLAYVYLTWSSGDQGSIFFYLLGIYNGIFGIYIINLRPMQAFRHKPFTTSQADLS